MQGDGTAREVAPGDVRPARGPDPLRERGLGVIVISDNLADVFQVADRIAVLRLGRVAGEHRVGDVTREDVVASITGADVEQRSTEETPL